MNIVAVANQKGGVGKSTTAIALGAVLKEKGYKVLYIDLDPQCNLTYTLRANNENLTVYDLLKNRVLVNEVIQNVEAGDIIPASLTLAVADIECNEVEGKEYLLKNALEQVADKYDYAVIDTPPALGSLTVNALTACNNLIIPAEADSYSLQGIGLLFNTIQLIKQSSNPDLSIVGILITRHDSRSLIRRQMAKMIGDTAESMGTKLFDIRIRNAVSIGEAQASRQSIYDYAPNSNVATDYMAFAYEFLERQGVN